MFGRTSGAAAFLAVAACGGLVAAPGVGCGSAPPGSDPPPRSWVDSNGCFDLSIGTGIVGCWYSYGASVTTPVPGQPFPPSTYGRMCTEGTVAVIDMADSAIRGAGIGFDFNNPGSADGGTGEKLPWDAAAHDITGFSFTIDTLPVGGQMRVEFPTSAAPGTTDIDAAYWGGETMNLSPFNKAGTYSFQFTDVGGPSSLTGAMPFDKTRILSMHFHVVANDASAIPFSYCISDLRALQN